MNKRKGNVKSLKIRWDPRNCLSLGWKWSRQFAKNRIWPLRLFTRGNKGINCKVTFCWEERYSEEGLADRIEYELMFLKKPGSTKLVRNFLNNVVQISFWPHSDSFYLLCLVYAYIILVCIHSLNWWRHHRVPLGKILLEICNVTFSFFWGLIIRRHF